MTDPASAHSSQSFYDLAPTPVASYRGLRYDGGGMGAQLSAFPHSDRELLAEMYAALQGVFFLLCDDHSAGEATIAALRQLYESTWSRLIPAVRALGDAIPPAQATARLRQILHDVKGGAFQALAMYLQVIGAGLPLPIQYHRMFFLARDQLKIMRNALPELDPEGVTRDEEQRLHAAALLVEKWQQAEHRLPAGAVTVEVDCHYSGAVAERCLEFAALDRVIYNLVNNAAVHSADGCVRLAILPVPPHDLRIVVINAVAAAQRRTLAERFPAGLGQLFQGGFTTGGSGLGLRICAEFVANAYGLRDVGQGLGEGHFGATFLDDRFVAWVHWPIAAD